MFLALDIGNSRVKCGLYDGAQLVQTFEMATSRDASVAAYRHSLRGRLADLTPTDVGISSVVPPVTELVVKAVRDEFMIVPRIVDLNLDMPFAIDYDPPDSLGADRICAAAGAVRMLGSSGADETRPIIVVDAGTAVTLELIDRGCYRGGAIAPGPEMSISALAKETAKLKEVDLALPDSPLGRNTSDGVRSGILFGLIDSVAAMIARLSAESEEPPITVSTGGWGGFIADHVEAIDSNEPHLVLEGIRWLVTGV